MKYTNSPVAFLCFFLGVTLTSFIPIVSAFEFDDDPFDCSADYVPQKPIDNFQLKTVGVGGVSNLDANQDQDDEPSPVRVYLNKFGMTVHLFYEGHPDHVSDTTLVDVTLYAASDASGVSSGRRRMDDRKVKFDSVSPTAGITSSFKGEDEVLKRHDSLSAASDASDVSSDRRRVDDRSVTFDSVSPTAGIASSFKGEDEVLKRHHSLSAASDASDVSSDRRRVDDRSVTFDSVSPTAGIASSFKGEDGVLKRRLDSGGEDCTPCDPSTVIEVSGTAFQTQVAQCISGTCPEGVPIECWDTSKVTDMSNAFDGKTSFNTPINCWNTARVTTMYNMFDKASIFNQPLDDWDVTRVVDMGNMFFSATKFNQPINDWDVANVDTMGGMFYKAKNFNQPLDDWNPASVSSFASMFNQAYAFNQSLDDWSVPSVKSMRQMFFQATNFDQCLSTWADKTPQDVDVTTIFDRTSCPNTSDPDPSVGPWCQEQCSVPSTSSAGTPPPCGENGVALPATLYDVTLVSYNDDTYNDFFTQLDASQCFPRTTNGVVAQAEIIMTENPFDSSDLATYIYDASVGTNDGQLQFCARIAYSIGDDDDKELISYIDTKVVLDVSIAADIEFTQAVDISSDQTPVATVNQDVSTVIEVDSFLCGNPEENDGTPYAEDYSLGQSFRVCVDVKAADEDKFRLTNFGEVKCSTASSESTIISFDGDIATPSSVLTSLFDNDATVGAKSFDFSGPVASGRAISFSTVVTNAYLTGDADTLTCVGSVDVDTVTQRRQLVSFTVPNPVSSSLSAGRRQMEEDTGAIAGAVEFGATIKLSPSSAASGRFSPLPMTTDGIVGFLLVIGVGPMMMMMMW